MELNFQTERKRQGFTLIELLVVVLIMGILASVALPQYFKSVEKSRAAEALDVLSSRVSAQERHYMKTGSYASYGWQLDIGLPQLNYFTVLDLSTIGFGGRYASLKRKEAAAAGLGSYIIILAWPEVPGTGERSWHCRPTSAGCNSFLPK